MLATGGLAPLQVPADGSGAGTDIDTRVPLLPLALSGQRLGVRRDPPRIGADTAALLGELG